MNYSFNVNINPIVLFLPLLFFIGLMLLIVNSKNIWRLIKEKYFSDNQCLLENDFSNKQNSLKKYLMLSLLGIALIIFSGVLGVVLFKESFGL